MQDYFLEIQKRVNEEMQKMKEHIASIDNNLFERLKEYIYCDGANLDLLSSPDAFNFLFKNVEGSSYPPFFEYSEKFSSGQKERYPHTSCGVFLFNKTDFVSKPVVLLISMDKMKSGEIKKVKEMFQAENKKIPSDALFYNFEIFEKSRPSDISKNYDMKSLFKDIEFSLEMDGDNDAAMSLAKETMEVDCEYDYSSHIKNPFMYLKDDMEKLHIKFMYGDGKFIPIYVGIGTNIPMGMAPQKDSSESYHGASRYHKFDLLEKFQETLCLKQGAKFSFPKEGTDCLWIDETVNNKTFALYDNELLFQYNNQKNNWYLADLGSKSSEVALDGALNYDWKTQLNIFPAYEEFRQVFYNPIRIIRKNSIPKIRKELIKNGLLGDGTGGESQQAEMNIASDLVMNTMDDVHRLKPSILFFLSLLNKGIFEKFIKNFGAYTQNDLGYFVNNEISSAK